uniref:Uncharacterized protein n=1 Tax=Leptobrachium leishanense TaxID=445787 RepID=A0A8C5MXJ2_9ANUR
MAAIQEVLSPDSTMQASNLAHVIFQNVAKTYLPSTPLECHYTLTQYIQPHNKEMLLLIPFLAFKSTCDCILTFQGYYVPNDDGEFYQFCYVTHKGEICGASTPFQFRTTSPVEKEELAKTTAVLEKEIGQLRQQVEALEAELTQEIKQMSESFKTEREEFKKKYDEMSCRIIQLEEDIVRVTQKAIAKETELDSMKDKLRRDVKELYKVHLKNTEIENTKLFAELQTLKNTETSKENLISQYKDEMFLGDVHALKRARRKLNHAVSHFVLRLGGGLAIRHRELEGNNSVLVRSDGVHLTDIGLDIFNVGLQAGIEEVLAARGVA